ncbi:hypothetical protein H1719_003892 [Escherichia coli]|uniref:hypothetical protein n=1 Tax=Escherichia coli TaxID=562 RepID=UPI00145EABE2|nr:hypothetical protein [Escherichia coli]EEQ7541124.1 hypothetical protein [Escherichia coli]EER3932511.1 hypothetical protein [Escherichia coli]EER3963496.1 hypothetical protein [Escherichia coli]EER7942971.1 hypothetical protein [Escherichia coli]EES7509728.1 hypothetical protein [Escherichia coli]
MRVACIGLLPYPTRFWASALIAKPHVLMADNIIPHQSAAIPVLHRHDEQQRNAGEQNDEKP